MVPVQSGGKPRDRGGAFRPRLQDEDASECGHVGHAFQGASPDTSEAIRRGDRAPVRQLRDGAGKGACSAQVAMVSVYGIEDDLTIQPLSDRNAASALTAWIWGRFFSPSTGASAASRPAGVRVAGYSRSGASATARCPRRIITWFELEAR